MVKGYKQHTETPNTQSRGNSGYVIIVGTIHNIITIAPMTSADKQKVTAREQRKAKRKSLQKSALKAYKQKLTLNL